MKRAYLALCAVVALAGCGDGSAEQPELTVSAASSLKSPFTEAGGWFDGAEVRFSFAGSDQLAAQVRAGARPDGFAAASEELPAALHREGLVERPVRFARNRLVVVLPADDGRVGQFDDLAEPGVRIAAGSPTVPVGAYARRALAELPAAQAKRIEANIESEEPDVAAVIGRVRSGAVDAGFAYWSEVRTGTELRAIELHVPVEAVYAAAVVRGSEHPEEARRFVRGLLTGRARQALVEDGYR